MAEFVEVIVEATGRREQVPAIWLGDPVLGRGIKAAPAGEPNVTPLPDLSPPSDVELTGPVDDLPIRPAVREAVLAAREAEAKGELPTEDNTHDEIDAFASKAGIDLGSAKTKAEKVAVLDAHLNTGGTEPADETPATGDKE